MKNTLALTLILLLIIPLISNATEKEEPEESRTNPEVFFHDHGPNNLYIPFLTFYQLEIDESGVKKQKWFVSFMMLVEYGDSLYAAVQDTEPSVNSEFNRKWVMDVYPKGSKKGESSARSSQDYINIETWITEKGVRFERSIVNINGKPYHLCSFRKQYTRNFAGESFRETVGSSIGDNPKKFGWTLEVREHPPHRGLDQAHKGGGIIHPG